MKLQAMLAGSAIAALALVGGAPAPLDIFVTAQAEAAVNISFSIFYDELGNHGAWTNYRHRYVFIPDVGPGWRPYTLGHWAYTKPYGWTWISDEPFGWATYHYGRWGYSEDIGWYWVPGRKWAPAWVSWRRSKDYVVWAPLPPSRHDGADISVEINVRDVPDFYWVAVPARQFLAPDLRVVVVTGDRDMRQVVRHTKFIGTPRVTNNIVINNMIDVTVIAKETGQQVRPVAVKEAQAPQEAKSAGDQVTVYPGDVAPDDAAKPKQVQDVTKIRKVKRAHGNEPAAAAPEDQNTNTAPSGGNDQTQGKKSTTSGTDTGTPATAQPQLPVTKPKDSQPPENTTPPAATTSDQPTGGSDNEKKHKKLPEATQQDQGGATSGTAKQAPAPKPKQQDETAAPATPETGQPAAPADQGKAKQKPKKDQKTCDPTTDAGCPPAQ